MEDLITYSRDSVQNVYEKLNASANGISKREVKKRQSQYGLNVLTLQNKKSAVLYFLSKFLNPLIITLIFVAVLSIVLGEQLNSFFIILMAILSVVLTFLQEHNASKTAEKLKALVKITAKVLRGSKIVEIPLREIVPGDIVELEPGKMIPADLRIISAKDLYINQSALNGESFPVRKNANPFNNQFDSIYKIDNLAFMGSNVVTGVGRAIVIRTGKNTEFGQLSTKTTSISTVTSFEKGINGFAWLMIRFTFFLVLFIFIINAILKGNILESLLFSLAIAIGLTPELLPMIVTVNLAKGAIKMSKKKVIVKELASIQNFGAMDILCTDKTGTLTMNEISLIKHCDAEGRENVEILKLAYINSSFQAGLDNLIDKAVITHHHFDLSSYQKIDEIPFDFERKMTSIVVKTEDRYLLISKGAPEEIIKRSKNYVIDNKNLPLEEKSRKNLEKIYINLSNDGFRVLAIAYKSVNTKVNFEPQDEKELIFAGFVAFLDPPKTSASESILQLHNSGVKLKILTGDNELVSRKICKELNFEIIGSLSGERIDKLSDFDLKGLVEITNLFTRMSPAQKERIIRALEKNNHIVGYLGDGINDAPSLKTADVGISVDNATDIAKETAQIILLEKSLMVLADCVAEGRKTFANVIKYIKMGASSNFGNMLSMTAASVFLPFLPMLPPQILLNNFLYDVSQLAIPGDSVDADYLKKPKPWDLKFIKEFMIYIGPISSIFDFATFALMWYVFHASPELFHTGWFVESLATQVFVVYIIRTRKIPFLESKPSRNLVLATLGVVILGSVLPYTFLGKLIGFTPLPFFFFLILILMVITYLLLVQITKNWFVKKFGYE